MAALDAHDTLSACIGRCRGTDPRLGPNPFGTCENFCCAGLEASHGVTRERCIMALEGTFDLRGIGLGPAGLQSGSIVSDPSINIGPGGISGGVNIGGIPIGFNLPLGGGTPDQPPGDRSFAPGDQVLTGCPDGTIPIPGTGRCADLGAALPGGDPFIVPKNGGGEIAGARLTPFGVAVPPKVVGTINNAQGQARPIRRCPPGLVLGKDNLCYMTGKDGLPAKGRKHRPRRPRCLTDEKVAAVKAGATAAKSLQKKFKGSGFTLKKGR